ncbi:hypothetical protein HK098_001165 [Nowakowskiella sp. JEL0407]|nr:hypothetical protein HK098_001165 [Nowakowskiella sp. JEL0407]
MEIPLAQTLQSAWAPLLAIRLNNNPQSSPDGQHYGFAPIPLSQPIAKQILSPEEMESISAKIDSVAKLLCKMEPLRVSLGNSVSWAELAYVLVQLRNDTFIIFGSGHGGVACTERAFKLAALTASHFQLVRNLCAAIPANQEKACTFRLYESAEEILSYLSSWLITSSSDSCPSVREKSMLCINMGTQMLANIMTANPVVQNQLWPHYFKEADLLRQLLQLGEVKTAKYVLLLIFNCTHKNLNRSMLLINSSIGKDILKTILREAKQITAEDDSLFDIIYVIINNMVELGLAGAILKTLCHQHIARSLTAKTVLSDEHLTFFQILDGMIDSQYKKDGNIAKLGIDAIVCISMIMTRMVCTFEVEMAQNGRDEVCSKDKEAICKENTPVIDSAILMLQIFGRLTMGAEMTAVCKASLIKAGFIKALISFLRILDILLPRENLSNSVSSVTELDENQRSASMNVKTDILRILSNLSHHSQETQNEVRELGGIPLILNHCRNDVANPFIREYAIFAIRNLCENNLENQRLIASMEARAVEQDPELENVNAYLDENGKLRLGERNRQAQTSST